MQNARWDANINTPTALAGLVNGALANDLGNPGNHVITPLSPLAAAIRLGGLRWNYRADSGRMFPISHPCTGAGEKRNHEIQTCVKSQA